MPRRRKSCLRVPCWKGLTEISLPIYLIPYSNLPTCLTSIFLEHLTVLSNHLYNKIPFPRSLFLYTPLARNMAVLNMRPTSSLVAIGAFVSVVCFVLFRGAWPSTM